MQNKQPKELGPLCRKPVSHGMRRITFLFFSFTKTEYNFTWARFHKIDYISLAFFPWAFVSDSAARNAELFVKMSC